jgi:hypothetical protein
MPAHDRGGAGVHFPLALPPPDQEGEPMDADQIDRVARAVAAAARSRRSLGRAAMGGVFAVLLGGGSARAAACRGNDQSCVFGPDCCSGRCENKRCRPGRLDPGFICTNRQECRSGNCGEVDKTVSLCRTEECRRSGRRCTATIQCCRGVCDAATFRCKG